MSFFFSSYILDRSLYEDNSGSKKPLPILFYKFATQSIFAKILVVRLWIGDSG